jgi:hypothetical protein
MGSVGGYSLDIILHFVSSGRQLGKIMAKDRNGVFTVC